MGNNGRSLLFLTLATSGQKSAKVSKMAYQSGEYENSIVKKWGLQLRGLDGRWALATMKHPLFERMVATNRHFHCTHTPASS